MDSNGNEYGNMYLLNKNRSETELGIMEIECTPTSSSDYSVLSSSEEFLNTCSPHKEQITISFEDFLCKMLPPEPIQKKMETRVRRRPSRFRENHKFISPTAEPLGTYSSYKKNRNTNVMLSKEAYAIMSEANIRQKDGVPTHIFRKEKMFITNDLRERSSRGPLSTFVTKAALEHFRPDEKIGGQDVRTNDHIKSKEEFEKHLNMLGILGSCYDGNSTYKIPKIAKRDTDAETMDYEFSQQQDDSQSDYDEIFENTATEDDSKSNKINEDFSVGVSLSVKTGLTDSSETACSNVSSYFTFSQDDWDSDILVIGIADDDFLPLPEPFIPIPASSVISFRSRF